MYSNRRILLTGGTGFFGRALLRHWIEKQKNGQSIPYVTVLTRSPEKFLSRYPELRGGAEFFFHAGDILYPDSFPKRQSFTHILHAATDSTLGPKLSPLKRYIQIVDGTRNMLDFGVACGARRFLLTSSGGVYGPQPTDMDKIPESYNGMPDPLSPKNAYSVAKRAAEHLCTLYHAEYGIEAVVARCFAFVGRDLPLDVHFAIGNFIRDALWGQEVVVGGDGTPVRSYLDQRDLAVWLNAMLENGFPGRAYNLGSDEAITIANLAMLVRDIVDENKPVRILGGGSGENLKNLYIPSIERARNELGLNVTINLESAIREVVRCELDTRSSASICGAY